MHTLVGCGAAKAWCCRPRRPIGYDSEERSCDGGPQIGSGVANRSMDCIGPEKYCIGIVLRRHCDRHDRCRKVRMTQNGRQDGELAECGDSPSLADFLIFWLHVVGFWLLMGGLYLIHPGLCLAALGFVVLAVAKKWRK